MSHCLLYRVVLNQPLMILERTRRHSYQSKSYIFYWCMTYKVTQQYIHEEDLLVNYMFIFLKLLIIEILVVENLILCDILMQTHFVQVTVKW